MISEIPDLLINHDLVPEFDLVCRVGQYQFEVMQIEGLIEPKVKGLQQCWRLTEKGREVVNGKQKS